MSLNHISGSLECQPPRWENNNPAQGPSREWLAEIVAQSNQPDAADFGAVVGVQTLTNVGGFTGEIIRISFASGATLIFKQLVGEQKAALCKLLGLNREAYFYQSARFAGVPLIKEIIPRVYYAHGDEASGFRYLLLEDLGVKGIQLGLLCGGINPNNWPRLDDLAEIEARWLPGPDALEHICLLCFRASAHLHASFWRDSSILDVPWLRASGWWSVPPKPNGEASWRPAMISALEHWTEFKLQNSVPDPAVWDAELVAMLDAAFARCTYDGYMQLVESLPFTLVHGDFHPANLMWVPNISEPHSVHQVQFLDWEMVGVGSGPQELSQFMISHIAPELRRQIEHKLVRAYYDELISLNPAVAASFDYASCWSEYVNGGLGRWLWFLGWMSTTMPVPVMKSFNSQVLSFARDHGVTAQNVPLPRI